MPARIVVVGSLNMDLVVRTSRMPKPGETVLGSGFTMAPGGKGANQAVAAARLGGRVSMIGRVGRDSFGESLLGHLETDGVDRRFVWQDDEAATGVGIITVDDSAQNSIVVASGANMRLTPADVEEAHSAIAEADILLLQLESPPETVTRAAELAQSHGVLVVLNPAPARSLTDELLALVDVLIPNEHEASLLTHRSMGTEAEALAAAKALIPSGVDTVILTRGNRGALLAQKGVVKSFPAYPCIPVDTTAAGDAFMGGLAVALAEKHPIDIAIRWGNAAGALATTRLGAQPSLPSREPVESLVLGG